MIIDINKVNTTKEAEEVIRLIIRRFDISRKRINKIIDQELGIGVERRAPYTIPLSQRQKAGQLRKEEAWTEAYGEIDYITEEEVDEYFNNLCK